MPVVARQKDDDAGALPFAAGHRDRATTLLHQQFDHRQSDTQPSSSGRRGPIEQFQHAHRLVIRYSHSIVAKSQLIAIIEYAQGEAHSDFAFARVAESQRIGDQVIQYVTQSPRKPIDVLRFKVESQDGVAGSTQALLPA